MNGTYTEGLEIVNGDSISVKVEQSVLQHASVTVSTAVRSLPIILMTCVYDNRHLRKDESIPVKPLGVLGVEVHEFVEQHMGGRGQAHRSTGVTWTLFSAV